MILRKCLSDVFRVFVIPTSLFAVILLSACSTEAIVPAVTDCGFSAYYVTSPKGEGVEITFSRVMAEVLNGKTNCGFGYVKTKVDLAQIDGKVLPEQKRDQDYTYTAPIGFDPRTDTIVIKVGGRQYVSDLETVKQTDKNVYISLKSKD